MIFLCRHGDDTKGKGKEMGPWIRKFNGWGFGFTERKHDDEGKGPLRESLKLELLAGSAVPSEWETFVTVRGCCVIVCPHDGAENGKEEGKGMDPEPKIR